ncbi:MAG: hypothetical protein ACKESB_00660 [Candidatus Hodgkinia cicadicola]
MASEEELVSRLWLLGLVSPPSYFPFSSPFFWSCIIVLLEANTLTESTRQRPRGWV